MRAAALLAAGWLVLFSWPVLVAVPDTGARRPWGVAVRSGLAVPGASVRQAAAQPGLLRFLLARMLYTDGLNTLFAFGGIYAAGSFGMDARGVLVLGIGLNVTAGLGALGFAFLEDRIGSKPTILVALGRADRAGSGRTAGARRVAVLGTGAGTGAVRRPGPVGEPQPDGAYRAGRVTQRAVRAVCAVRAGDRVPRPDALGAITAVTGSQRAGMAVIVVLLVAGAALLAATRVQHATAPRQSAA